MTEILSDRDICHNPQTDLYGHHQRDTQNSNKNGYKPYLEENDAKNSNVYPVTIRGFLKIVTMSSRADVSHMHTT